MTGFRFLLYERYMKTFSIILGMVVFGYNTVRELIWILVKYNLLKYS